MYIAYIPIYIPDAVFKYFLVDKNGKLASNCYTHSLITHLPTQCYQNCYTQNIYIYVYLNTNRWKIILFTIYIGYRLFCIILYNYTDTAYHLYINI